MKATHIGREENTVTFKMDFSAEEFDQAVDRAYKAGKGRFTLDGFRKGKAPRKLIEARYGEDVFFEDAVNQLFSVSYPQALDELKIEPVDQPDAEFSEIKAGQDFTVTLKVDVPPEVTVQDYKGLKKPKFEISISEEDVDKEIEQLRKRNGRIIVVDRPAKAGDSLVLDYAGSVDGVAFEGGTAERQPLTIGSGTFIPGFEEQLIGAVKGEQRDVKVKFPEDYPEESLAGKEAVFSCTVHEVKETELPELNDDFAKDVSVFETLEELRQDARKKLEFTANDKALYEGRNAVLEQLYDNHNFDIPEGMIRNETENMLQELAQQLKYQGLTMEQYLQFMGKDVPGYKAELRSDAVKRVKTRLLVEAVAQQEGLEATDEDIETELSGMAAMYKTEPEKMKEMLGGAGREMMKRDIRHRKAVNFLFENAVIEEQ
ncbi:MAG TPA: trigger factor [Clostridiales bacterium]|jgi:trigger factor|nr:trigger factor [Clostridiales bacterium]